MNVGGAENMNELTFQEADILTALYYEPFVSQRILSETSGHSLGVVNRSLKSLKEGGYLDEYCRLSAKARELLQSNSPRNAIILAAGAGMRMVPINVEVSKGLLEIKGERLIERTIRQLHEAGIQEIYVVVGFLKEQYEYLIDEYGVELIVNPEYARKNNLYSLSLACSHLSNTYVIPCDIWCSRNPYRQVELYSWYMVSDRMDRESSMRVNRKMEIVSVPDAVDGNAMLGISYLQEEEGAMVAKRIEELSKDSRNDDAFWEKALYKKDRMLIRARIVDASDAVEINTYEQLRELDSSSNQLKSEALAVISKALGVTAREIVDIKVLKKGMTNRSFLFTAGGKKYIMRIPGEGTDRLINRKEEASVYQAIAGKKICDEIVYLNPENGYKISEFLEDARVCDPLNNNDLQRCMGKLREFHRQSLKVEHEFDIFGQIDFYETLWNGTPSVYRDYCKTKEKVFRLKAYIDKHIGEKVLTHIDAVPDNFLFAKNGDIRLIDWEYAGMQDPHVDIAMFCIYALYNKRQIDHLIDVYFENQCPDEIRIKIYCYIAACGLLWSNWCEYKRSLGVEFGEYSLRQYRYAKEYYKIVAEALSGKGEGLDV